MTSKEFIQNVLVGFNNRLATNEQKTLSQIDIFLKSYHQNFIEIKTQEFIKLGKTLEVGINSARQSWRPLVGDLLVKIIKVAIDKLAEEYNFKICEDKELKKQVLNRELSDVRKAILIDYGQFLLIPDGDLILYKYSNQKATILAILSFKTSFRERFTKTPYWKLKLLTQPSTKDIKVLMITTDNDDEIAFITKNQQPRKARIVMEQELDGIFIANQRFEYSNKVKKLEHLFDYIIKLCQI